MAWRMKLVRVSAPLAASIKSNVSGASLSMRRALKIVGRGI